MKKRIILDRGTGLKLAKAMDCTPVMVSVALNYHANTEFAKKIRWVAVKHFGGIKVGG